MCLRNHHCGAKERSTAYSVCVSVVLGTQHAKHMRHIILSSVDCPAVPYFFTLSHKPQFLEKVTECKMVFDFFYNFVILRRIQRDIIINVHRSSCKIPVIPVKL